MPTKWETFPIKVGGGLITSMGRLEQGMQAPGSATILDNFEEDIRGGYSRVLGYIKFDDSEVPGTGQVTSAIPIDRGRVIALRGPSWVMSSGSGWTNILPSSPAVRRVSYDHFNFDGTSKLILVDGVGKPAIFNTLTNALERDSAAIEDVEGSTFVRVFKNHVFFSKGNILTFTAPYNEKDYTPANGAGNINIGDNITGMIVFRDQLIIFCSSRIMRLTGNTLSDFVLSPIAMNTGCLDGHTVKEVGGDVMYLAPDGVRYLSASERDNDFGLTRASSNIQNKLVEVIREGITYTAVTIASKNQYRLFYFDPNIPTKSTKNFIAVKFSDQTSNDISWSNFCGVKVYSVSQVQDKDLEFTVFTNETGHVFVMESGSSFDGEPIEYRFETPYLANNDPKIRKTFYKHTIYTSISGKIVLYGGLKFDYDTNTTIQPEPFTILEGTESYAYDSGWTYDSGVPYSSGINLVEIYNNVQGSGFVTSLSYFGSEGGGLLNINFIILEFRTNERK